MASCPLCESSSTEKILFKQEESRYGHCLSCDLRFLEPDFFLSQEEEKKRYLFHQNDVNDVNYQNFVRPLFEALKEHLNPRMSGLDFGAGRGPVLSKLFEDQGFKVAKYDPYFWPDASVLKQSYDFVFACEVVEHFYYPGREWARLRGLLKTSGVLGVMTSIYEPGMNFESWYYRKDPTHACFYSRRTFEWLKNHHDFSYFQISGNRTVCFQT